MKALDFAQNFLCAYRRADLTLFQTTALIAIANGHPTQDSICTACGIEPPAAANTLKALRARRLVKYASPASKHHTLTPEGWLTIRSLLSFIPR